MRGSPYRFLRGAPSRDVVPRLRDSVRRRRLLLQDLKPPGRGLQRGQLHALNQLARRHLAPKRPGTQISETICIVREICGRHKEHSGDCQYTMPFTPCFSLHQRPSRLPISPSPSPPSFPFLPWWPLLSPPWQLGLPLLVSSRW